MTLKDNDKITEQAWKRVYIRLEQDGLLSDTPRKTTMRYSILKWSAVAAVLCISIFSILFFRIQELSRTDIIVLNNDKNAPTLVSMLEDGSIVYLSEQTSLEYPNHFSGGKREVILNGNAFFDISKDKGKPFIIETKQTKIEVLGTSFDVKSRRNESFSLSVRNGVVRVTSKKDGQVINVEAGETVLFESDNLHKISTENMEQFQAYFNQIHFKDQRLADVIKIINQNTDTLLLELAPGLENRLLTVTFSENTSYTMAQLICLALDLQFVQQPDKIIIYPK